jgi:hypothetical protein
MGATIDRFENVPAEPGRYVYRISHTGASSAKLGPCEVCGKPVSDVHIQVEGVTFALDDLDGDIGRAGDMAVTHHGCRDLFGHEACLRAARRGVA